MSQRDEDLRRLKSAFAAAFDRSRVEALLANPGTWPEKGLTPLGEGTCFEAWLLPSRSGRAGGLDLVVKRGRPEWLRTEARRVGGWQRALDGLRRGHGIPLLPPFELVRVGEEVGLVMPRGKPGLADAAARWQPVAPLVDELGEALRARGLRLGDVAQLATWDGVPFVYDLSDVGPLEED